MTVQSTRTKNTPVISTNITKKELEDLKKQLLDKEALINELIHRLKIRDEQIKIYEEETRTLPAQVEAVVPKIIKDALIPLIDQRLNELEARMEARMEAMEKRINELEFPQLKTAQIINTPETGEPYSTVLQKPAPQYRSLSTEEMKRMMSQPRKRATFKTIYIRGMVRSRPVMVRNLANTIGINPHWLRHIDFIGYRIAELVVFEDHAQEIIDAFKSKGLEYLNNYDPRSAEAIHNEKFLDLPKEEKEKIATQAFETRRHRALTRMTDKRFSNLRSYLLEGPTRSEDPPCPNNN